jgi:hypothetical protein
VSLLVSGLTVIGAVAGFLNVAALRRIARLRRDSFVLAALHQELVGLGVALWLGNVRAGTRAVRAAAAWPPPSARPACTAPWPTPPPTSGPPSTPDAQREGWVRAKNSSALRVLGSWGPAALRPWPCTNLTAPAYTSSTFWGVALVDSSTSGTWPG